MFVVDLDFRAGHCHGVDRAGGQVFEGVRGDAGQALEEPAAQVGHVVVNPVQTYRRHHDMVFHMKTTLNIDDGVMARLKEEAARRADPGPFSISPRASDWHPLRK